MEQVSKQHEAAIRRQRADMLRRHVIKYGQSMGLESQLSWLGVAEAELRLADALELTSIAEAAE
jgi:hypothetical protein